MNKKDQKKVGNAGKAPKIRRTKFVEHKVSDAYREYLKRQRTAAKDEVIEFPKEPFGAIREFDPNYWDRKTKKFRTRERKQLPIQGPPNWTQIWPDMTSHGKDWEAKRDLSKCFEDNYEQTEWKLEFGDEIGSGAYGKVYRVQRTTRPKVNSEGEIVPPKTDYIAAKILNLERYYQCAQPDSAIQCIERMLSDMTALCCLDHENIVKILDCMSLPDSQTGFPFTAIAIFMELCDGNLKDIVPLPREQSLIWLKQIADAVHYLHEEVHRSQ